MFELSRQRAVAGDRGPAIVEQFHVGAADVDHRLDGEEHAGLQFGAGAGAAGVDHFRAVVEQPAEAMAAKIADDAVAVLFGMALDGVADVAEPIAGPRLLQPEHQAFIGHVDQLAGLDRHIEEERIVTIEDSAELKLGQDHVVRLEAKPAEVDGSGRVSINDLVINSLRMRPERVVIGECRGGETMAMLQAMNTGHDGSLTTLHANTPRDSCSRMETMAMMAGMDMPLKVIREQVASAIDLIVQQTRLEDGQRKVSYVTEVQGMEGDIIVLQDIFVLEMKGKTPEGRILTELKPTGTRPRFTSRLEAHGFKLPASVFGADVGNQRKPW